MIRYVWGYMASAAVFCALDALWLGVFATDMYRRELGALLLSEPRLGIAGIFYVLFIVGIQIFAVLPARGVYRMAALRGGLFGFFTYMTYDLTNLVTLRGWSETIVIVDILWGCVVTACAALAGCWAFTLASRKTGSSGAFGPR